MKKIIILSLLFFLSSCSFLNIVSAAKTVVGVSNDRRSIGVIADDNILDITLEAWAGDNKVLDNSHLNFTVYDGVVLITGEVPNKKIQDYIKDNIYTQSDNIKKVLDETIIAKNSSILTRAKDSLLDNKIGISLLSQEVVNPEHIVVHTENGVVYLMGDVTIREAKKATEIVAKSSASNGVRKIVKHFNYLQNIPFSEIQAAKKKEQEAIKRKEKLAKKQELDKKRAELEKQLRELEKQSFNL